MASWPYPLAPARGQGDPVLVVHRWRCRPPCSYALVCPNRYNNSNLACRPPSPASNPHHRRRLSLANRQLAHKRMCGRAYTSNSQPCRPPSRQRSWLLPASRTANRLRWSVRQTKYVETVPRHFFFPFPTVAPCTDRRCSSSGSWRGTERTR